MFSRKPQLGPRETEQAAAYPTTFLVVQPGLGCRLFLGCTLVLMPRQDHPCFGGRMELLRVLPVGTILVLVIAGGRGMRWLAETQALCPISSLPGTPGHS